MIYLRLTTEQATALHDLLVRANIEPQHTDPSVPIAFDPAHEHILWPVLEALRQHIQIDFFAKL